MNYSRCLALAVSVLAWSAQGADFCLTRDGQPAATIVLARDPVHAAAFAASELRWHVERITGAKLPIAFDDAPVAGPRILVGESATTRALGLSGGDLQPQEYIIRFFPDALVLLGKDSPERNASNVRLHGSIERVAGKFGRALEFSGSGAVTFQNAGFNDDAGAMEAWVRLPQATQTCHGTILRVDGKRPWTYHIVQRVPKDSRIEYVTYDGKRGSSIRSRKLSPGWHHVAATWSVADGKEELFVDRVSQGTATYRKTTCAGETLHIGGMVRQQVKIANGLRGAIDEVRVSSARRAPSLDAPKADDSTLVLLHFDEAHGAPKDSSGVVRPVPPPDWFDAQATAYAAHDFLERFCNVRWYGPGELGLVCPRTPTLRVAPRDVRRKPAFAYRFHSVLMPRGIADGLWGKPTWADMRLFWARLRLGGEPYACNHSFYGYYDRFWKRDPEHPDRWHPDWFAQGYKGKPPQMCYSNPEFIAQVVHDARDYFDGKGAQPGAQARGDYFALVPMDNNLWCKCSACQVQMHEDQRNHPQFSNGMASDYVFTFCNKVARAVAKTHPHKFLSTIAYHDYFAYPRRTRLEPNISVQLCMTVRHWWAPGMKRTDLAAYHDWVSKEKGRRLFLWLYYCFPEEIAARRGWNCFPGFFAHTAARQIKMFAADGIRGAFLNGIGEQVDTYVTLKLFDDPSQDVDALLDEFFTRYYGAAAQPMKRLYLRIEEIFSTTSYYPKEVQEVDKLFHQTEEMAWGYLGTAERMAELGRLMAQARQAATTDVEKRRVGLFDKAVWQYMVEGRRKYVEKKRLAPQIEKMKKQPPPKVRVPRVGDAGRDLKNVDWAKAARLAPWRTLMGLPTPRKVEARIGHDGQRLFVQLEERVKAADLVSRADVWSGDDWELFFAARRAKPYHQLGVAPNGKQATNGGQWRHGMNVASTTAAGRWVVQVSLPLATLVPGGVKPGGTFYANFYRASPRARNLLAWSPNFKRSFHELSRLGEFTLE